jgi:hypothetical protein
VTSTSSQRNGVALAVGAATFIAVALTLLVMGAPDLAALCAFAAFGLCLLSLSEFRRDVRGEQ